jgi:hypothetical protein
VSNFGSEVPAGAPVKDQFKQILESLPGKPPRSRLAPYCEFIEELRRLGRTYRDIAAILAEKCQVYISPSAIHDFIRIHSREKTKRRNSAPDLRERSINSRSSDGAAASENQRMDAVLKRIAALKGRDTTSEPTTEPFRFNPSETLRLIRIKKDETG